MKKIFSIIFTLSTFFCNAQRLIVNGFKNAAPSVTYTTFNPSFTEPGLILSNGDLSLTSDGATNGLTRSIDSIYQNTYCEITVTSASAFSYAGLVTSAASRGGAPGEDAFGWSFRLDGFAVNNFSFTGYGSSCTTAGTIIGISYNVSSGNLEVFKNDVSMGVMFAGLNTSLKYYISIGCRGGSVDALKINFGATAFVYSGHYSGLYH